MMFYVCYVYCNKIVCLLLSGYLRMGLRGRELMSNVGKVMIQGGGTFGTFMSIGTAIRCWDIFLWLFVNKVNKF